MFETWSSSLRTMLRASSSRERLRTLGESEEPSVQLDALTRVHRSSTASSLRVCCGACPPVHQCVPGAKGDTDMAHRDQRDVPIPTHAALWDWNFWRGAASDLEAV